MKTGKRQNKKKTNPNKKKKAISSGYIPILFLLSSTSSAIQKRRLPLLKSSPLKMTNILNHSRKVMCKWLFHNACSQLEENPYHDSGKKH